MRHSKFSAAAILLATSGSAFAHPGHDVSGFSAGLLHPFSGLDHLLAMFAVGLWAAQSGGRKMWLLPAAFMSMLATGAVAALNFPHLPFVETGISASVLALGLLVALSLKLPTALSITITALFGFMHGYAHGLELPSSASPATYALGFLAATATLHLCGIGTGTAARKSHAALGMAIAACGAWMLVA